jgi:LDH2 family malate/lactate/ureidoglycolate dehydrogenase
LGAAIFKAVNVNDPDLETIVDVLVSGSLWGIDSHGVREYPYYVKEIQEGRLQPDAKVRVRKRTPMTALIDAKNGIGFVAAKEAVDMAVDMASKVGLGAVGVCNSGHIGNLFYYLTIPAEHDMIGLVTAGGMGSAVAPWGGCKRVLGTNPIGFSIPTGGERPIVLDIATSAVSNGQLETYVLNGKPIPEGWLIDSSGNPVSGIINDLSDFWNKGGSLLPFGTYKGYGINLLVEILSGALTTNGTGNRGTKQGMFVIAINIGSFTSSEDFKAEVDRFIADIKSSAIRQGYEEILLPGEREFRIERERRKSGIPVDDKSWDRIEHTCMHLGIETGRFV